MELKKIVDPIQLFKKWLSEAEEKEIRDPNAMQLATVSKDGMPSVRTVLLKDIIDGDFVFYTNYEKDFSKGINLWVLGPNLSVNTTEDGKQNAIKKYLNEKNYIFFNFVSNYQTTN